MRFAHGTFSTEQQQTGREALEDQERDRDAANNAKWIALGQPEMVIPVDQA